MTKESAGKDINHASASGFFFFYLFVSGLTVKLEVAL